MGKKRKKKINKRNPMAMALHSPIFHGKRKQNKKLMDKENKKAYSKLSIDQEDS